MKKVKMLSSDCFNGLEMKINEWIKKRSKKSEIDIGNIRYIIPTEEITVSAITPSAYYTQFKAIIHYDTKNQNA